MIICLFISLAVRQVSSPEEKSPIQPLVCERPGFYLLYAGPYRDFKSFVMKIPFQHYPTFIKCFTQYVSIANCLFVCLGIMLHLGSLHVIFKLTLWKERKYLQLLLLNFTSIFVSLSLLFFLLNRFIFELEQFMCVLGFQIFALGGFWNTFSLLSLTTDCVVAVFWPLKFRSVLTTKQFFWFNGSTFISFIIYFVASIYLYGFANDGLLRITCAFYLVFSKAYRNFTVMVSAILNISLFVLNVAVTFGVIVALTQRNIRNHHSKVYNRKLLKLACRILAIVFGNIVCNLFLNFSAINVLLIPDSLAFLLASSSLYWNIIIFGVSDAQFRAHVRNLLRC